MVRQRDLFLKTGSLSVKLFSCDPAVATPSMVGFYSPRAQQQIAAPVDKMHFTRAVALAHLPANQP
jgi:hypothetical protein